MKSFITAIVFSILGGLGVGIASEIWLMPYQTDVIYETLPVMHGLSGFSLFMIVALLLRVDKV